jgi:hypothetical protein
VAENSSENRGVELLYQNVEVGKKGLYMDGGPTMAPHFHRHYFLSSERAVR